ncbi:hypothetical protein PE36_12302 [Moritella sp. PE36]|uniref:hypothetical protein n=1 Tax=Moritella sp. PE36 TaxID=58051 RepID=UPI000156968C|nr:hypothetical protein [Moritella sp. PE36]EDM64883.1 hypothetical protein PE36_12302 [Moritella sp. PE36]
MFNDETKNQITKELVIERFKFIQEKQKYLDSVLHTNMTFIVKLLVALFGLVITGISLYKNKPELMSEDSLMTILQLSSLLCCFICGIFLLMSFSNIVSWFGYRNDEVKLLDSIGGSFRRDKPKKRNFLTWQETWFILALLIITISSFTVWMKSAVVISYLLK